ncbi:MAG: glycosyltransferase family 4 protein [Bacteroidales bacterium]|nr:glycosyltransferase family 4 protein [Bacteroidales bacterium]
MKILVLANKMPYPPKDGGAIATLSFARSLRRCGCEVDMLAMNTPKHFCRVEDIPTEISTKINFFAVEVDTTIKATKALCNLLFSSKPYNAERFVNEAFAEKLKALLSEKQYDVVQLEGLYLCPYIETIRKYSSAKIALRAHNVEHEIWKRMVENEKSLPKRLYKGIIARRMRRFELSYINDYDLLVPITDRDADFFSENGNTKPVYVAQSGIEPESPLLSIDNSKADFTTFSFLGALDWQPNIEGLEWFVRNVWNEYRKKHCGAKFRVAGRNADKKFADFLISNGIDYLGELESVVDFYASGLIFVVPLMSGSGMRIKIVEAMSAGKVVITTSIGTEGIATENGRNIFIADSVADFLSCMEKVASDKVFCDEVSAKARDFVKNNYDNNVIATRLLDFYKKVEER